MGSRAAQTRAERLLDHLQQTRHIKRFGTQVGGKQHKPCPAAAAIVRCVVQGLITPLARMKQQRGGVMGEHLRGFRGNAHQGVGHQQCTRRAMQTAHLLKAADTQVQGPK